MSPSTFFPLVGAPPTECTTCLALTSSLFFGSGPRTTRLLFVFLQLARSEELVDMLRGSQTEALKRANKDDGPFVCACCAPARTHVDV